MARDPNLRPLLPRQREFVHLIVYNGLTREEAYAQVTGEALTDDNRTKISNAAQKMFFLPHVYSYYNALMEDVRDKAVGKALWTKEIAEKKLLKLVEQAEQEIYGDPETGAPGARITMSRLNAIILPVKELNLMNGLNQTNVNMNGGCIVQFVGEDEIPD